MGENLIEEIEIPYEIDKEPLDVTGTTICSAIDWPKCILSCETCGDSCSPGCSQSNVNG